MNNSKYFGTYIERNFRIIKQAFLQAFKEAGIDLTTEQWVILDLLFQQDGVSQTELANKCQKDAPTTSRIIDLMCKKGFIERKTVEDDRRKFHIFLTNDGREIYEKIAPIAEKLRQKGWNNLEDSDYDNFLRIMNKIYDNFR